MKTKNLVVVLVLIVLAVCASYWAWTHLGAGGQQQGQQQMGGFGGGHPVAVSVVTVETRDVVFTKDLPGRSSAFRVAEIRPQVSGIILKRLFEEGSDVEEGQQLYQIDPATYQAAYDSAQADLLKAQANIKSVQAKEARYAELVKIGGISKQEFDDVRANLAQSKADIAIAEARLAQARINLDYTRVLSPISGRIGQSLVTEGALVTANQPAALATVQQIDKIYVDVTQSSEELMRLRRHFAQSGESPSMPMAQLVVDGKLLGGEGRVQFSDVTVNPSTGTVLLRILFDNTERDILPGLFIHARLAQSHDKAAILISQKAVIRNADSSTMVWVVGADNKVEPRPVTVADALGDQWHVTQGLQPGDRVIVEGIQKVSPGAVVTPVDVTAKLSARDGGAKLPQTAETPPELILPAAENVADHVEVIETPDDQTLSGSSDMVEQEQDSDDAAPVVLESTP